MRSTRTHVVAKGIALGTLGTIMTAWLAGPAAAFNPQPDPPGRLGMVGITRGQTARLNVVNIGDLNEIPCQVELRFLGSDGDPLAVHDVEEVPAGQATFVDLNADALGGPDTRPGERFQIRGLAVIDQNQRNRRACRGLVATLEVFDTATGQTMVILPAV